MVSQSLERAAVSLNKSCKMKKILTYIIQDDEKFQILSILTAWTYSTIYCASIKFGDELNLAKLANHYESPN